MTVRNQGFSEHPLAKRHPRLVSSDQTVREALNEFYGAVFTALDDYQDAVTKAQAVSKDLKDAARAERQHRQLDAAKRKLNRALDVEVQALNVSTANIRQEVEALAKPKTPPTEFGQLLKYLREQELRAELRKMDTLTRARLLRETAGRGDPTIMDALSGSLTPICAPQLLADARQEYTAAVATEPLRRLEITEHIVNSAKTTARLAQSASDMLVAKATDILPKPAHMALDTPAKDMTAAEKADFIAEHGLTNWKRFIQGEWTPAPPAPEAPKPTPTVDPGIAKIMESIRSTAPDPNLPPA